jgi:hypothetical protein
MPKAGLPTGTHASYTLQYSNPHLTTHRNLMGGPKDNKLGRVERKRSEATKARMGWLHYDSLFYGDVFIGSPAVPIAPVAAAAAIVAKYRTSTSSSF